MKVYFIRHKRTKEHYTSVGIRPFYMTLVGIRTAASGEMYPAAGYNWKPRFKDDDNYEIVQANVVIDRTREVCP